MSATTQNPIRLGDRAFCLTFAGVFLIFSAVIGYATGRYPNWAVYVSATFAVVAVVRPGLLWPLNRFWCGVVAPRMGGMTNRIALGAFFFLVLTPAAWVMRWMGRDPMTRKLESGRDSYFEPVLRQATPETFRDVF